MTLSDSRPLACKSSFYRKENTRMCTMPSTPSTSCAFHFAGLLATPQIDHRRVPSCLAQQFYCPCSVQQDLDCLDVPGMIWLALPI